MATSEEQHRRSTGSTSTDKQVEELDSRYECSICYVEASNPVVLACGHFYCWKCIHEWLTKYKARRKQCPICKSDIQECDIIPVYGKGRVDSYEKSRPAAPTRCRNRTEKKETTTVDDNWINVLKVGAVVGGLVGAYFMGKHTGKKTSKNEAAQEKK